MNNNFDYTLYGGVAVERLSLINHLALEDLEEPDLALPAGDGAAAAGEDGVAAAPRRGVLRVDRGLDIASETGG